jgi:ubiquinone/menaquinone biosynthesis C-methylase UbiE
MGGDAHDTIGNEAVMDPAEYSKMYDVEDSYWWFQGRRAVVMRLLERLPGFREGGQRVLDLGCGTGLMLEQLQRLHWTLGLDFSPLALNYSRRRGARNLLRADAQALPFDDGAFDLITALDIAEHIERDDVFYTEAYRVLRPGGRLVATVPAFPFLWSDHDRALHHHRRYTRRAFVERLREAGFRDFRVSYCITFTFPIIAGFRLLQKILRRDNNGRPKTHVFILPKWANNLLLASVEFEGLLLRWTNLPIGVSLVAVAQKPAEGSREMGGAGFPACAVL